MLASSFFNNRFALTGLHILVVVVTVSLALFFSWRKGRSRWVFKYYFLHFIYSNIATAIFGFCALLYPSYSAKTFQAVAFAGAFLCWLVLPVALAFSLYAKLKHR
jgi:hypothetical protein